MNVFDELELTLRHGYNSEKLSEIKLKLTDYLKTCPEEEKNRCQREIDFLTELIKECVNVEKLRQQYTVFHDYIENYKKTGDVDLEYIEPFGNSYGVYVKIGKYVMELVFKPMDDPEKNEVRTRFYFHADRFKGFMIRKDSILPTYTNLRRKRRDYYPTSVGYDSWGDFIISCIKTVLHSPQVFLYMCQQSCPFNDDGTHKFKSWKTRAKVEIAHEENSVLIQGVKNGGIPIGNHIVGSNGSFRYFGKGDYVLKLTLDCLSFENPIRHTCYVNVDKYIRNLKEMKQWGRNMPYKKVNALLCEKIEVITYDMNKNPEERTFFPTNYEGNWVTFLEEKLCNA